MILREIVDGRLGVLSEKVIELFRFSLGRFLALTFEYLNKFFDSVEKQLSMGE